MRQTIVYILLAIIPVLWQSCRTTEKIAETTVPQKLTEEELSEYRYALTEATKQKLFGNYQQAAVLYQKCIEVNPRSDAAYFQLSGIFIIAGNIDGALRLNRKAIEIDPDNYWYRIQMGQLYGMKEEADSAIMIYEGICNKWPEKIEVCYELARLYAEYGKYLKALKILDEIEKENGISATVSILKEQIYIKEGKPEIAEKELTALLKVAPEDVRYLGMLAELYGSLGKNGKALETYKRIFEIEPDYGIAQLSLAEFYNLNNDPENQFAMLDKAFSNNSLQEDRKMEVLIGLMTDDEVFRKHTREILSLIEVLEKQYPGDYRVNTAKADYYSKTQKYEDALKLYDKVLQEQKGNYFIWEQCILIENMLQRPADVYKRCNEALLYFSDRPVLYLFKGNSAMQLGRNGESVSVLEEGLKYASNNIPLTVQFYSNLAEAWRNEGNFRKSDEYFDKAILMEPENLILLNNYAYYLSLRSDKLKQAEKMSKKTILQEPENPTFLDTYAWILYKSGKAEEAKKYLLKAIQHGGDKDPDILEHLGDVLHDTGENEKAMIYWKRSREYGNTSEILEKKIGD